MALKPITGFVVQDNGVGFTPENMSSFETLDTDYKASLGCRGVGRLLWLKAFDKVSVRSAYVADDGQLNTRQFKFSIAGEVEHAEAPGDLSEAGTTVHLDGFKKAFQKSAPKSADAIAREIFEHCIWYFLRPGCAPDVTIVDDEVVSLNQLMDEFVYSELPLTTVEVKGQKFEMANLCLKSSTRNPTPRLYWCAANRVVMEENLTGKIPGLYGRLKDKTSGEFAYACYLSSDYLDKQVRADRTAFDISEQIAGETLDNDISVEEIRSGVLSAVEKLLSDALTAARDEGKARVSEFVSNRAPRYRPGLARLEALGVTVDPSIKDQDLELLLHRQLQKLEADVIQQGQAVFAEAGTTTPESYQERLNDYLQTVTDINQSDLAAYVSRRRAILDALRRLIRSDEHGKYTREDAIHSLLMPMRTDSNEIGADASNLWIIVERLAFHDYLGPGVLVLRVRVSGASRVRVRCGCVPGGDRGADRRSQGVRAAGSGRLIAGVQGGPGGRGCVLVPGGVAGLLQGGQLPGGGLAGDPGGLGDLGGGGAGGGRQRGHDRRCRAGGRRRGGCAGPGVQRVSGALSAAAPTGTGAGAVFALRVISLFLSSHCRPIFLAGISFPDTTIPLGAGRGKLQGRLFPLPERLNLVVAEIHREFGLDGTRLSARVLVSGCSQRGGPRARGIGGRGSPRA